MESTRTSAEEQDNISHLLNHRQILRKSVAILGGTVLLFIPFYVIVGCIVLLSPRIGKGVPSTMKPISVPIYIMTFILAIFKLMIGILLLCAASKESVRSLTLSMWLNIVIGMYSVILGTLGVFFFFTCAEYTINFLLGLVYIVIAFTILEILCVDVVIINAYRREICGPDNARNLPYILNGLV